ncbi:hypothetical protein TVAG_275470 [Trichomonas vaginalis G3]|uniref:Cell growth regulator with RING finger domain protein 1 n=1 Tax=Trichomonas vaginalis (strain ATCC PRA-98 / G3) TaxID=412133 RepID=A2FAQ1_TRIV3|nr:zinc finger, C3HC4-type (RING finger)-containing protein [Trichomonas vaginalis G3]EAX98037.1 hypothetical protein TVAG_275470 [Trichomonas vaginalis G3]KAI5528576.1 zinc finger, C3HC4-type (RING finger)-containing protein [Trichomonas vaginalis G3]|eukprot:XP_001310967.1 hypothetical protein [Trichomonas vaginalis G3]
MGCASCLPLQQPLWYEYYGPIRRVEAANAINAAIADNLNFDNAMTRVPIRKVTAPHIKVPGALNKPIVANLTDTTVTISFSTKAAGTMTLSANESSEALEFANALNQTLTFNRPTDEQWTIKFDFEDGEEVSCRIIKLNAKTPSSPIVADDKIVINGKISTINKVFREEDEGSDGGFNDGMCLICCSAESTVIAFPCRHCCMCSECAERFATMTIHCPVCRAIVTELIDCAPNQEQNPPPPP